MIKEKVHFTPKDVDRLLDMPLEHGFDAWIAELHSTYRTDEELNMALGVVAARAISEAARVFGIPELNGGQRMAVIWGMIQSLLEVRGPMRLQFYAGLLDYKTNESSKMFSTELGIDDYAFLRNSAEKLLAGDTEAPEEAREHWRNIVKGVLPHGYTIRIPEPQIGTSQ